MVVTQFVALLLWTKLVGWRSLSNPCPPTGLKVPSGSASLVARNDSSCILIPFNRSFQDCVTSNTPHFPEHKKGVGKRNTHLCVHLGLHNTSFGMYCATQGLYLHMGRGGLGSGILCKSECYNGTDLNVRCIALRQLELYRSDTVNSKSFVGKDFLQNKWKYELTVHFKHEMIGK